MTKVTSKALAVTAAAKMLSVTTVPATVEIGNRLLPNTPPENPVFFSRLKNLPTAADSGELNWQTYAATLIRSRHRKPSTTSPISQCTAPSPSPVAERMHALDTTPRASQWLGILLMNIWSFAGPQAISDYPPAAADWGGAPLATWAVVHTLFEGSQRALFSMLFGAGMLLMVTRLQAANPDTSAGRIYYRRLGWLMAFGLFDAFVLLWAADILLIYALCGLLLYPLRRFGSRELLVAACVVFALHAGIRVSGMAGCDHSAARLRNAAQRDVPRASRQMGSETETRAPEPGRPRHRRIDTYQQQW